MFDISLSWVTRHREGTRNDTNIDVMVAYIGEAGNLLAHRLEDDYDDDVDDDEVDDDDVYDDDDDDG